MTESALFSPIPTTGFYMTLYSQLVSHSYSGLLMPLDHLGLLTVSGDDAADFLHNQLTNDMLRLPAYAARLAGYCSPKGRLIADFLVWKSADHIDLQCPAEILPAIQKRLSMFVLRTKAKVIDASASVHSYGLVGQGASAMLQSHFGSLPDAIWSKIEGRAGSLIRVPDSMNLPRWLWLMPAERAETMLSDITLPRADAGLWHWLEVRAALPHITATTQDCFVPQMINYEAIGGVNFKKGCYPGQEVVARSQYLGKLKRRMALAHLASEAEPLPQAGDDLFEAGKPEDPVGSIVNRAQAPEGGVDLLIELPAVYLTERGPMQTSLQTRDGRAITLLDLPYALPEQDIFVRPKL